MRKAISNSGAADGTTDYYYSNWQVVEEYDLVGASETLKFQYVWGGVYHDELICRDTRSGGVTVAQLNDSSGQERQFQHGNSLFSVFAVTDESGTVLERYQYDPYGNPTVLSPGGTVLAASTIDQEFLYTGQRLDEEFELYYYKNRYYSAEQGRFISRDPIGYVDGMALYQYVGGRPTIRIDSFGNQSQATPATPGSTTVTRAACLNEKTKFEAKYKCLINKLKNDHKCFLTIDCPYCPTPYKRGTATRKMGAGPKRIDLHYNNIPTVAEIEDTFRHELQHTMDYCSKAQGINTNLDCKSQLFREIRARWNNGQCGVLGYSTDVYGCMHAIAQFGYGCKGQVSNTALDGIIKGIINDNFWNKGLINWNKDWSKGCP